MKKNRELFQSAIVNKEIAGRMDPEHGAKHILTRDHLESLLIEQQTETGLIKNVEMPWDVISAPISAFE